MAPYSYRNMRIEGGLFPDHSEIAPASAGAALEPGNVDNKGGAMHVLVVKLLHLRDQREKTLADFFVILDMSTTLYEHGERARRSL